ncbi:MAG: hydrogenase formation protein HypD [Candidatus Micrarchaeota archaeon]
MIAGKDRILVKEHVKGIAGLAKDIGKKITIMEVCGGHTSTIMQYGIREILPKNIRLISGPGCPVCVSAQRDIDNIIALADNGTPVATYGDMLKVPGSRHSLDDARAKGGNIFEVYSAEEVLGLQEKYSEIVFFGVGFETTAPMSAFLLGSGVPVYSVHKLVPPALKAILSGEVGIDGFIDPGHVSAIIGIEPYKDVAVPQVISGFTPERILRSIRLLLELIKHNKPIAVNGYPEVVREEGNIKAQALLRKHFVVSDSEWRGIGAINDSGLEVRDQSLNAKEIYADVLRTVPAPKKTACRCGEVLRGVIEPSDCPLYKKRCSPENAQGPCMVSSEGTCAIAYRHGG